MEAGLIPYAQLPDAGDEGLEDALWELELEDPSATRWQLTEIPTASCDDPRADFLDDDWLFLSSTELRPIYVARFPDGYHVLDGRHRVALALEENEPTIHAYLLVSS